MYEVQQRMLAGSSMTFKTPYEVEARAVYLQYVGAYVADVLDHGLVGLYDDDGRMIGLVSVKKTTVEAPSLQDWAI